MPALIRPPKPIEFNAFQRTPDLNPGFAGMTKEAEFRIFSETINNKSLKHCYALET